MSGTFATAGIAAYNLAFQVSPIILYGGIASTTLGNALPIIGLTGQLLSLAQGIASSGTLSASDFFATFVPVPGGTIINNSVATYPFANQQVAANAIIQNPNTISLCMIAPVKDAAGYLTKLALFSALRTSLQQHNVSGGYYYVATPAKIYGPCLMTGMTDITSGETHQQQVTWQIDFIEPLLTQQQAQAAQSTAMAKITAGQAYFPGQGAWSGSAISTGAATTGATASTFGAANAFGAVNNFLSQPPI